MLTSSYAAPSGGLRRSLRMPAAGAACRTRRTGLGLGLRQRAAGRVVRLERVVLPAGEAHEGPHLQLLVVALGDGDVLGDHLLDALLGERVEAGRLGGLVDGLEPAG